MSPHRLELDYIARPRRSPWAGLGVLALALVVAGFLALHYGEVRRQLAAAETARGMLNEGRPARTVPRERLDDETKQVDAIVRQLTLPWAQIIETIENASIGEVAVLQMQPEAEQRRLRLTAEAKSREAMLRYIRRLEASKALTEVHLVSHQVQLDDPSRPIQFALQASFMGAR
jgi:Tfp pilus assembly protein PilN